MPRAALLSIHARVAGTGPSAWEDPSLLQLWGPRYSVYVVAERDFAIFSRARLPDDAKGQQRAERIASALKDLLAGRSMRHDEAESALGLRNNELRYATLTGAVRIRWDGARQPIVWCVPAPAMGAHAARLELARRYLHIFGPTTVESFREWAGIRAREGELTFSALRLSLTPVQTPVGDGWILADDEETFRAAPNEAAPARILPSGDALTLLQGADRELLVPDAERRNALWTPRVWPGAVLIGGELAGTWRRADAAMIVQPWRPLTRTERDAVAAEVDALPLPGIAGRIAIRWDA